MKLRQDPPKSVQEARAELQRAEEAEREHRNRMEREREEEQRAHAQLLKQAAAVVAGVRRQVDDVLKFAEEHPPQPHHAHWTVCRAYRRGLLVPPDAMESAESRVAMGDPVLTQLLSAAEEAARRLAYYTNPMLDSWLRGDDAPIIELDELEATVWQAFTRRVRTIASED
jgi:hypothetical protein